MNANFLSVILITSLASGFCLADTLKIKVTTIAPNPADNVVLQSEDEMSRFAFSPKSSGVFEVLVPKPNPAQLEASSQLYTEYRLLANWSESKAQLYIKLHSLLPKELAINVYHNQIGFNVAALEQIDKLGTDLDSLIEKYCRARAFHRKWRYDSSLPNHYLALRSARIWFDASVALALRRNSAFLIDKDVVKIMSGYEAQANVDDNFSTRYRRYAPAGYVRRMLDEVKGAEYAFVSLIPKLIAEGKSEEAYRMNSKALSALSAETNAAKFIVRDRQGVDVSVLLGNSALLETKLGL